MAYNHFQALKAVDPTATQKTQAYDCCNLDVASFTATLAGMTSTIDCTFAMEVSNDLPPADGLLLSQNWQPAEASWVPAKVGGNAVSAAISATGTTTISCDATGLTSRWVRAKWTHASGNGGTLDVIGFARSL